MLELQGTAGRTQSQENCGLRAGETVGGRVAGPLEPWRLQWERGCFLWGRWGNWLWAEVGLIMIENHPSICCAENRPGKCGLQMGGVRRASDTGGRGQCLLQSWWWDRLRKCLNSGCILKMDRIYWRVGCGMLYKERSQDDSKAFGQLEDKLFWSGGLYSTFGLLLLSLSIWSFQGKTREHDHAQWAVLW